MTLCLRVSVFRTPFSCHPPPPASLYRRQALRYTTGVFALVLPDLGDAAVDRLYSYFIPPGMRADVHVGGRVTVPLGSRQVSGYVLALEEQVEVAAGKVREISAVKSAAPAFTAEQAALARWLADTYLCPISEALRPCLAESGAALAKRTWQCTEAEGVTTLLPDPALNGVLRYIREHPGASSAQVRAHFNEAGVAALEALRRDGLIRPMGGKRLQPREINAVVPALAPAALLEVAEGLPARAAKQAELLRWSARMLPAPDDRAFIPLTAPGSGTPRRGERCGGARLPGERLAGQRKHRHSPQSMGNGARAQSHSSRVDEGAARGGGGDRGRREGACAAQLSALGRDGQRKNRGLSARHRAGAGCRTPGDRAGAGDLPHRAGDGALPWPLSRPDRRVAQPPLFRRTF